jgi:glycosyltransferase involved in cell wall biosynthesis
VKFLFVHQNFPGQYLHIVRHLAASGEHEILFVTEPNQNAIPGVRKLVYRPRRQPSRTTHPDAREFENAMIRGEAVGHAAAQFRKLGLTPDIIIGHHGWGELLNVLDLWPDVPLLGYFEFYYRIHGLDVGFDPEFPADPARYPNVRAKNAVNHLALTLGRHGQTPTRFQRNTYPAWAQPQISIIPEGANLDQCSPRPALRRRNLVIGAMTVAPREPLLTYVARGLEPYRGFHTFMRALPAIQRARPNIRIAIVGSDEVSYGATPVGTTWREYMLKEVGDQLDLSRVHFLGRIEYDDYRALLQRSDAHVYLTYPFVASWSLREALAIGCVIVASNTEPVREFITDGQNGLLVPFPDPAALSDAVLRVLEDKRLAARLRANARAYAEANLQMSAHIAAFTTQIARLTGQTVAAVES